VIHHYYHSRRKPLCVWPQTVLIPLLLLFAFSNRARLAVCASARENTRACYVCVYVAVSGNWPISWPGKLFKSSRSMGARACRGEFLFCKCTRAVESNFVARTLPTFVIPHLSSGFTGSIYNPASSFDNSVTRNEITKTISCFRMVFDVQIEWLSHYDRESGIFSLFLYLTTYNEDWLIFDLSDRK